ncbi:hypothetical protein [Alkalihalobacterium alkalinitrilicum]|nr:hypothetical protein [Alkalihalobacterium alkalinitrilicum]
MDKIAFHIYECEHCAVVFAVEQAFDEQHLVKCPVCCAESAVEDIRDGEM